MAKFQYQTLIVSQYIQQYAFLNCHLDTLWRHELQGLSSINSSCKVFVSSDERKQISQKVLRRESNSFTDDHGWGSFIFKSTASNSCVRSFRSPHYLQKVFQFLFKFLQKFVSDKKVDILSILYNYLNKLCIFRLTFY